MSGSTSWSSNGSTETSLTQEVVMPISTFTHQSVRAVALAAACAALAAGSAIATAWPGYSATMTQQGSFFGDGSGTVRSNAGVHSPDVTILAGGGNWGG